MTVEHCRLLVSIRRVFPGTCLALLWFVAWDVQFLFAAGADATTLSGIGGFQVEIGALSRDARDLGFTESGLRKLVRGHLRRNALSTGNFAAVLNISLRVVAHPARLLAYSLELEVLQVVHLKRTEQIVLSAPTWMEGTLTLVPREGLVRSVESALSDLVDALGRDYRLVNS